MYGVIIALIPALLVSFFYFGIGSAIVCLSSVAACVFFEWAITKYLLKKESTVLDGSAILTGILLGFNLPSNLPVWIIIIGALVAIGVGKMTFGGLGCNPFNPALVGRCFLLVSFPVQMTSWPKVGQLLNYTDAETAATPLSIMKTAIKTGDANQLCSLVAWFGLYVVEENHNLAYTSKHHCYSVCFQWYNASDKSCLCFPNCRTPKRWSYVRCHLYGYRLCYVTYDI